MMPFLVTVFALVALYSVTSATTTVPPQLSNASEKVLQCVSCTTIDIEHVFVTLQSDDWRRRILDAPFAPKTTVCKDLSTREKLAQSSLKPVSCENGICGQMQIEEKNGDVQIYRSCIKNHNLELHSNCTKLSASVDIVSARMCLCATSLCNTKSGTRFTLHYSILTIVAIIVTISYFEQTN